MENRREKVLSVIDEIDWTIHPVPCDDFGDPHWQWCVEYTYDGDIFYDDYWHNKPDNVEIYNALLSVLKDGAAGDYLADLLERKGK